MFQEILSADQIWVHLGARWIRWRLPDGLRSNDTLIPPKIRSALGKFARRLACPEVRWREACPTCSLKGACTWFELFPGSAGDPNRLAPWVLHTEGSSLFSLHLGTSPAAFDTFWLAWEATLAQALGLDRSRPGQGPRWLQAELTDPRTGATLTELTWGSRDLPMGPAPEPLSQGTILRFRAPLELRTGGADHPPAMADWLRLGRNRLSRLAQQVGRPLLPAQDPRWRGLSESAAQAQWKWEAPQQGSTWGPVPKHRFELSEGWRGSARVESLPEAWSGWSALLPFVGVGSHIPFGCGLAEVDPIPPVEALRPANPPTTASHRQIQLRWKDGIA